MPLKLIVLLQTIGASPSRCAEASRATATSPALQAAESLLASLATSPVPANLTANPMAQQATARMETVHPVVPNPNQLANAKVAMVKR